MANCHDQFDIFAHNIQSWLMAESAGRLDLGTRSRSADKQSTQSHDKPKLRKVLLAKGVPQSVANSICKYCTKKGFIDMWCGTKKLADDKHIDFLRRHYCHEPCPVQKDPSKYCNKCGGKKSAWNGKGAHAKTCPNYTPPERNGSPDRKHKEGTDRSAERTSTKRVAPGCTAGRGRRDDSTCRARAAGAEGTRLQVLRHGTG